MTIQSVGIREFKARLSEYLKKVKGGRIIEITDRGEPIGRIVPALDPTERSIKALQEAGCISWNGRRLGPRKAIARVRGSRTVSDLIVEDRE
jgi:prevent-host-death family protein